MAYFPMFVSLDRKPCLIVGGGRVAARKCRGLLACGADVTVVAETFPSALETAGRVQTIRRRYRDADITARDWTLVIAATNERAVNGRIADVCRSRGIPVNVADCPEECTFYFPAYCVTDNVAAGISSSGFSPALSAALRRRLEKALPEWINTVRKEEGGNGQGNADRDTQERAGAGADPDVYRGMPGRG